jgi:crotonobetainyl-CoA:carnitine CoA-transferase CaiB-like acyl-CoA transferase
MFFSLSHDELGMVPQVGSPWKLKETAERKHQSPPQIGQHDEEVYGEWLQMGRQDLEKLRKAEVIR